MRTKSVNINTTVTKRLREEIFDVDVVRLRGLAVEPRFKTDNSTLSIPRATTAEEFIRAYEFCVDIVEDDVIVKFPDGIVNMRTSWGQYTLAKIYELAGYDSSDMLEEAYANGLLDEDVAGTSCVLAQITLNTNLRAHGHKGD